MVTTKPFGYVQVGYMLPVSLFAIVGVPNLAEDNNYPYLHIFAGTVLAAMIGTCAYKVKNRPKLWSYSRDVGIEATIRRGMENSAKWQMSTGLIFIAAATLISLWGRSIQIGYLRYLLQIPFLVFLVAPGMLLYFGLKRLLKGVRSFTDFRDHELWIQLEGMARSGHLPPSFRCAQNIVESLEFEEANKLAPAGDLRFRTLQWLFLQDNDNSLPRGIFHLSMITNLFLMEKQIRHDYGPTDYIWSAKIRCRKPVFDPARNSFSETVFEFELFDRGTNNKLDALKCLRELVVHQQLARLYTLNGSIFENPLFENNPGFIKTWVAVQYNVFNNLVTTDMIEQLAESSRTWE